MRPRPYVLGTKVDVAAILAEEREHYRKWNEEHADEVKTAMNPAAGGFRPIPRQASFDEISGQASFDEIPHSRWCPRFNVPTDESRCAYCDKARNSPAEAWPDAKDDPIVLAENRAAFIMKMRGEGAKYSQDTCPLRKDFGEKAERKCCGGLIKQVSVFRCYRGIPPEAPKEEATLIERHQCTGCLFIRKLPCAENK